MDIKMLSMVMNQAWHFQQQAAISVMTQVMDQTQIGVEALTNMMPSAEVQALQHEAQPHLGENIDLRG